MTCRSIGRNTTSKSYTILAVIQYSPAVFPAVAGGHDIEIPCRQFSRLQTAVHKLQPLAGNFSEAKLTPPHSAEILSGEDRFWAHRAIFLADNTRPVHGPGQTAASVYKRCSQSDWPSLDKLTFSEFLFQSYRTDCSGGADVGTGDTIKLAATGADAKIENGAPQSFQSTFQAGGMNYVGWANSHALAAFKTASEKIRLC
jgi:hypothetical protein